MYRFAWENVLAGEDVKRRVLVLGCEGAHWLLRLQKKCLSARPTSCEGEGGCRTRRQRLRKPPLPRKLRRGRVTGKLTFAFIMMALRRWRGMVPGCVDGTLAVKESSVRKVDKGEQLVAVDCDNGRGINSYESIYGVMQRQRDTRDGVHTQRGGRSTFVGLACCVLMVQQLQNIGRRELARSTRRGLARAIPVSRCRADDFCRHWVNTSTVAATCNVKSMRTPPQVYVPLNRITWDSRHVLEMIPRFFCNFFCLRWAAAAGMRKSRVLHLPSK